MLNKLLKQDLKALDVREQDDLHMCEKEANARLLVIQQEIHSNLVDYSFSQLEKEAQEAYMIVWRDYHTVLQQKEKLHWLKEGDENSQVFFNNIKARHKKNTIQVVQNQNGRWVKISAYITIALILWRSTRSCLVNVCLGDHLFSLILFT